MHVHDLVPFQTTEFDTSHTVNHLAFGQEFPGMTNPLDKVAVPRVNSHNPTGATGMYQYFLKVRLRLQPHACFSLRCGPRLEMHGKSDALWRLDPVGSIVRQRAPAQSPLQA